MFGKLFPDKPWLTNDGIFLIFDYVHLLKNIRNNWLTEKTSQLIFIDKGVHKVAQWDHLKMLYEHESKNLVKLSNLNEVSIFPKPIERQSISSCRSPWFNYVATQTRGLSNNFNRVLFRFDTGIKGICRSLCEEEQKIKF